MTIFLVGHMDGDTFVPCVPTIEYGDPELHGVYAGSGVVREIVGLLDGGRVATVELERDSKEYTLALENLWNSEEDIEEK